MSLAAWPRTVTILLLSPGKINGDADKIAVCGESAGGTMSIVMSMLAKQRQQPFLIKAQIAICPGTDLLNFNSPSFMEFADDEFEVCTTLLWQRMLSSIMVDKA